MSKTCEFASDEWIDAMREIVQEALADVDLTGVQVRFYEEYLNPPAHLLPDGKSSITWHVEITDQGVDVGPGRVADPEFFVEADYQGMLPVFRQSAKDPELIAIVEKLQAKGLFRHVGDPSTVPAQITSAMANVRDAIAKRTRGLDGKAT